MDLGEVLGLTRTSILSGSDRGQNEHVATSILNTAEVLMHTVQEQATDIATITTRLEDDLRMVGQRVATAVEVLPMDQGNNTLGPPQMGP
jgi:hypothetical protein